MTIKLRARVWKFPDWDIWCVSAYAPGTATHNLPPRQLNTTKDTHPEALEAAYTLMADLDRELMAEVHESRSSRRAARVQEIAAEALEAHPPVPPVFPMIPTAAQHLRAVSPPSPVAACDWIDPHTMEATA